MKRIALTMGDPSGVGAEVIVKALSEGTFDERAAVVVLGDRAVMERALGVCRSDRRLRLIDHPSQVGLDSTHIHLLPLSNLRDEDALFGRPTREGGEAAGRYILEAARLAMAAEVDAIVTAPINKKALQDGGYAFPGHTELLADATGAERAVMMLAGDKLRVALVTTHLALRDVPAKLSVEGIVETTRIVDRALREWFDVEEPAIGVCALNPHGGEEGVFGREEERVIAPVVEALRAEGLLIQGPWPADTLFRPAVQGLFDAVLCMYHDQGLIPFKLLHFHDGVNVTLGLPIIRTSPDHGTAYDLAGTATASPSSLMAAIDMAVRLATVRGG